MNRPEDAGSKVDGARGPVTGLSGEAAAHGPTLAHFELLADCLTDHLVCPRCGGSGEVGEIPWTSWHGRLEQNPENYDSGPCPVCHGEGAVCE